MRARSTRLPGAVRERAIIVSCDNSSSSITSASACRHATMLSILYLANQDEGLMNPLTFKRA
jgi:hypothetical protein